MNSKIEENKFHATNEFREKNNIYKNISLRELIYAVLLGVMGGFISSLIPFSDLMKLIYPFVGGQQLTSAHHIIWMSVGYGITKKKSVPIITALIKGFLEALLGDSTGALIILISLFEGVSLVIGFWIMERFNEQDTKLGWAIAGGIGNFFQAPVFWTLNGRWGVIHWSLAVISFIFAFISGCLIAGLLGRYITSKILKAKL